MFVDFTHVLGAPCSVSPTLCFVIGTTKNTIMTELFMDREMNY